MARTQCQARPCASGCIDRERLSRNSGKNVEWAQVVSTQLETLAPSEIVFLAGKDYRDPLIPWCQANGVQWHAPLAGMSIGRQLAQLQVMCRH
uniref:DUF6884 domain-containing protein n=1 Tax=Cupriavidus gilardii TaxID=82541 RepID=UPI003D2EEB9B